MNKSEGFKYVGLNIAIKLNI